MPIDHSCMINDSYIVNFIKSKYVYRNWCKNDLNTCLTETMEKAYWRWVEEMLSLVVDFANYNHPLLHDIDALEHSIQNRKMDVGDAIAITMGIVDQFLIPYGNAASLPNCVVAPPQIH